MGKNIEAVSLGQGLIGVEGCGDAGEEGCRAFLQTALHSCNAKPYIFLHHVQLARGSRIGLAHCTLGLAASVRAVGIKKWSSRPLCYTLSYHAL